MTSTNNLTRVDSDLDESSIYSQSDDDEPDDSLSDDDELNESQLDDDEP